MLINYMATCFGFIKAIIRPINVFYCLSIPGIYYIIQVYTTVISVRWEYKAVVCCSTKILVIFLQFRYFTKNIVMHIPNKLWLLVLEYPNDLPRARGVTPDIYMLI